MHIRCNSRQIGPQFCTIRQKTNKDLVDYRELSKSKSIPAIACHKAEIPLASRLKSKLNSQRLE